MNNKMRPQIPPTDFWHEVVFKIPTHEIYFVPDGVPNGLPYRFGLCFLALAPVVRLFGFVLYVHANQKRDYRASSKEAIVWVTASLLWLFGPDRVCAVLSGADHGSKVPAFLKPALI